MNTSKPNFFIVGAPKCGTTSLYEHLRRHPDVFMPHSEDRYWMYKEPYFFCEELIALPGLRVQTEAAYAALFEKASGEKRVGEATALYLYSEQAPHRIKAYAPEAKIIIVLRDPVAMMMSWHHDCVRWGHEIVSSFEKAVLLQKEREAGRCLPPGSGYPTCLFYTQIASFSSQVQRYMDVFGKEAVQVWLLSDFKTHPERVIGELEDFLEINRSHATSLPEHNTRKVLTRSDMIKAQVKSYLREYAAWAKGFKWVIPPALAKVMQQGLRMWDKSVDNPAIDPEFLDSLRAMMEPDVVALQQLLDRDLSAWVNKEKDLVG